MSLQYIKDVPGNAPAIGPYTPAIRNGNNVICSGILPLDESGKVVEGGLAEQTRQVLENMNRVLAAVKAKMEHVLRVAVVVSEISPENFAIVNRVYSEYFDCNEPARYFIESPHLPKGALIEMVPETVFSPDEQVA